MKKLILLGLGALAVAGGAFAANDGSTEAKAIVLTPSTKKDASKQYEVKTAPVVLHQEGGKDLQVCYFKMTLKKGSSYTVWLSGAKPEGASIAISETYQESSFSFDFNKLPPLAKFECAKFGNSERWVVSGEEWDRDDEFEDISFDDDIKFVVPSTWAYYIVVRGKPGETATLNYAMGNHLPEGIPQNPLVIVPTTTAQVKGGLEFQTPTYTVKADLTAGLRYYIATEGGSAGNELSFAALPEGKVSDYAGWASANNASKVLIPSKTGTCHFMVNTMLSEKFKPFSLKFRVDAQRTPPQHKPASLAVGGKVTCKPGYLNKPGSGAYDPVIDEVLYVFSAAKGVRYVAETSGAKKNLLMRVYDEKGTILAENRGNGRGPDVCCGIPAPTKKMNLYVGVCEDLGDDDTLKPAYSPVTLSLRAVAPAKGKPDAFDDGDDTYKGANSVAVYPGEESSDPISVDTEGHGPHQLSADDWYDTFVLPVRKGVSYALKTSLVDVKEANGFGLTADVFTMSGSKEKAVMTADITPGAINPVSFTAADTGVCYVRIRVTEGYGVHFPAYRLHAIGYLTGKGVGTLKVSIRGTDAGVWTIDKEKTQYGSGAGVLLPAGAYTVKFSKVKGFGTPADRKLTVVAGKVTEFEQYYGDTYDPKDDQISGKSGSVTYKATSWSLKNAETEKTAQARTLWKTDPADNFEIAGKDGYLYDFHLDQEGDCDAVFSISGTDVRNVTSVRQVALPASKAKKYYLTVSHKDPTDCKNTSYSLNGHFANVGAIKFSKAKMSVKDTATSVKLTVNRTAKDGMVKVHYRTVAGTAKANEQFVPDEGDLEWADKDSKAKTVEIKLIPKLLALKTGDTAFKVVLTDAHGEYPAPITVSECEITIKNSGKYATAAAAYAAANKTKQATVKTETVPLRGGTFFGVLSTEKSKTGLAALASVTLTVSAKTADDRTKDTVSAKVALAGKTYAFKPGKGEPTWDGTDEKGRLVKRLVQVQKIGKQSVSNVLEVAVVDGSNAGTGWTKAVAEVKLMMNVPDAKGSGYQAEVPYSGQAFRQNTKINDYLAKAYLFAGYYTVSLLPGEVSTTEGQKLSADGKVPSGNGYLTVTVDNKGTAKLAGLLPDNTKVSVSATACGIVADGASANGYAMEIPVFVAKSPYCCGGWIRLCAQKDSNRPDGKTSKLVVDLANTDLRWNNDNAAITYQGTTGWRMSFNAVGGWYDKVFNLQAYYNDYAAAQKFDIEAIKTTGFPKELLSGGYSYVSLDNAQIDDAPVDVAGNTTATKKKALVKSAANRKLNDLGLSTNPCNIQVKLARATGIVTGGFSLWSQSASAQKEITGFKHYGVITLDRDDGAVAVMDDDLISSGFLHKVIKIGKRNWAFSMPFNISAEPMDD